MSQALKHSLGAGYLGLILRSFIDNCSRVILGLAYSVLVVSPISLLKLYPWNYSGCDTLGYSFLYSFTLRWHMVVARFFRIPFFFACCFPIFFRVTYYFMEAACAQYVQIILIGYLCCLAQFATIWTWKNPIEEC